MHAQKKEKRKVKKREHVSKSEIPPAFEQMIKRSAHDYIGTTILFCFLSFHLEEIRAKKHMTEVEKRLHEERKVALEEGNRMIRIANFQRFNAEKEIPSKSKAKFAWGVDQRRRSQEKYGSISHKHPKQK